MVQTNEFDVQEGIDFKVLNDAREDKGWTIERTAKESGVPDGTVKKILNGHTKNPGSENLSKLCKALGVPMEMVLRQEEKKEIEKKGIQEGNDAIVSLKEIYELQLSTMRETNEIHIANIRSHYEQHHQDLVENFEKRLSDKREIIDEKESHIKSLKRECLHAKIFSCICIFVLVSLLIAEVMNPTLGWLRF